MHWDWVELGRLSRDARRLPDALRAAKVAAETAEDDEERSVAVNERGEVQKAQGESVNVFVVGSSSFAKMLQ